MFFLYYRIIVCGRCTHAHPLIYILGIESTFGRKTRDSQFSHLSIVWSTLTYE